MPDATAATGTRRKFLCQSDTCEPLRPPRAVVARFTSASLAVAVATAMRATRAAVTEAESSLPHRLRKRPVPVVVCSQSHTQTEELPTITVARHARRRRPPPVNMRVVTRGFTGVSPVDMSIDWGQIKKQRLFRCEPADARSHARRGGLLGEGLTRSHTWPKKRRTARSARPQDGYYDVSGVTAHAHGSDEEAEENQGYFTPRGVPCAPQPRIVAYLQSA